MVIKQQFYNIVLKGLWLLGLDHCIPDELYLRMLFYRVFGKKLNLEKPKTYNEKLQWMKLNYRPAILTKLVDKSEVKCFVANKIGKEYVIPTLGVWKSVNDIDFNSLPEQFVLKCTHDSGGIAIIKDKAKMEKDAIEKKLSAAQKRNHYWSGREWPYKNVVPRIIAEPYLEDKTTHELSDYKFFCFNGIVKIVMVATERQAGHTKFDFYDTNFQHLPFRWGHDHSSQELKKPQGFEAMLEVAANLSSGFPHVRVDLYNVEGKIYFGELTFFHWSGMCPFEPEEWDEKFGEWMELPE